MLLEDAKGPERVAERQVLKFAKTMLEPLPTKAKVFFVTESSHMEMLSEWMPSHNMLTIKPYLSTSTNFKDILAGKFLEGAKLLVEAEETINVVKHKAAKQLLMDFKRLRDVAKTLTEARWGDLAQDIFMQSAEAKLGVTGWTTVVTPPLEETDLAAGEAMLHASRGILDMAADSPLGRLRAFVERFKPRPSTAMDTAGADVNVAKGTSGANLSPPAGTAPTVIGGAGDGGGGGGTKSASSLDEKLADPLAVGDSVVTIAGKDKDRFDNRQARVIKVWSQKVRVCILEGPATNEEKDFAKTNIRKLPPDQGEHGEAGGPKKKAKLTAAEFESDEEAKKRAKRAAAELAAQELFGGVSLDEN